MNLELREACDTFERTATFYHDMGELIMRGSIETKRQIEEFEDRYCNGESCCNTSFGRNETYTGLARDIEYRLEQVVSNLNMASGLYKLADNCSDYASDPHEDFLMSKFYISTALYSENTKPEEFLKLYEVNVMIFSILHSIPVLLRAVIFFSTLFYLPSVDRAPTFPIFE